MDCDTEQLNLLAIFHYVVAGLAALFSFFPCSTRQLAPSSYLPRGTEQPNRAKTCPPNFLAGFLPCSVRCCSYRNSNGNLYSDCRSISCAPQTLLVRFHNGLHRMSLHSLWNNSRSVYDCCAFTRICAGIILYGNRASAELKLRFRF